MYSNSNFPYPACCESDPVTADTGSALLRQRWTSLGASTNVVHFGNIRDPVFQALLGPGSNVDLACPTRHLGSPVDRAMLYDNHFPRYLPHLHQPEILKMGLSPLDQARWIETDSDWPRYHHHKLAMRRTLDHRVYRAAPESVPAQRELADLLLDHLTQRQGDLYRIEGGELVFGPGSQRLALQSDEPLWNCSLWVADDLVIMQRRDGAYRLGAASLCSPSDWLLEEKIGRPLTEIHRPIPGFTGELTPRVDRFLRHLRAEKPVVRFNWSLQAGDELCRRPPHRRSIEAGTHLFYRSERQTLSRLPRSGAIAFTIRVYLHPLERLAAVAGALPALFAAIDKTPPALAAYKGFDTLAPALEKYRGTGEQIL